MMTKKQPSLLELVKADIEAMKPKPRNWFERLPEEEQKAVEEIRSNWRAGLISCSCSTLATRLIARCNELGITICGHQGVREWLSRG